MIKTIEYSGDGLEIFDRLWDQKHLFFLDSSLHRDKRGRYSFIGFDPFEIFVSRSSNALTELKKKFKRIPKIENDQSLPFQSGIMGFVSYDYGLGQQRIQARSIDDLQMPHCYFGFYDVVITIDHVLGKLHISSSGLPETDQHIRETRAKERLDFVLNKIKHTPLKKNINHHQNFNYKDQCNFSKEYFTASVEKALDHIARGDIYQVNLSQRFEVNTEGHHFSPVQLYRSLRNVSPSPFGGYFDCGGFQLMSNSPERFLHLKDGIIQTRPMKGTRPRGKNEQADSLLKSEIINSEKDQAELLMITDLERNDLGRVCEYGSVHVKKMRMVETYETVFQTTSLIEGRLKKGLDGFDALQACFPGGSITGCPKIRAMEIIEELEPTRRGAYTGSMGYIDFSGNMDFNILIRTLLSVKNKIYYQVGGGIVADSTPEGEYQETLVKAMALRACLKNVFQVDLVEA